MIKTKNANPGQFIYKIGGFEMTFKYSFITKISHLVQSDFASLWIEKQPAA